MSAEGFGPRMRYLREQAGLTQQALADRAGISLGAIRDLEQERCKPTWESVLVLATALGVECTAFIVKPTTVASFGTRLKELRERAGMTQQELCQRAGLTRDGVAQLEQGRRKPAWETVLALAEALAVTPNDFTATDGTQTAPPRKRGRPPRPKS